MASEIIRVGGASFDPGTDRARAADGTETELRRQSAEVLRVLIAHHGETVSKDALMTAVWGDVAVTEDSLVQCIADIRRGLGESDRARLRTVSRRGYLLERDGDPAGDAAGELSTRPAARIHPTFAHAALGATVALLAVIGLTVFERGGTPAARPVPNLLAETDGPVVAVLPFEPRGDGDGDPRWQRLARGLTEEVIADLAANSWIFVLADATTRPLAGATPRAVRDALGATYVVAGSVQTEPDRVRVSASLADAVTGRQVWAKRWTGAPDSLLSIQTAASEALVGELAGRYYGAIARADRALAHRQKTESLEAYELYLLGVEHKHRFTPEDFDIAEGYLKRATAIDPGFAKAWVTLSIIEGFRSGLATDAAALEASNERSRAYVAQAMAADPDDPGALSERSKLDAMAGDFAAAGRALRRAVALAPNDADTLAVAAWSVPGRAAIGHDALTWVTRAAALNPTNRTGTWRLRGEAAFTVGDDALAVEALGAAPPSLTERWIFLAAAEAMRGDLAAARAAAAEVRRQVPDFDLTLFLDGYWEPDLRSRLREGALRAGLGDPPTAAN